MLLLEFFAYLAYLMLIVIAAVDRSKLVDNTLYLPVLRRARERTARPRLLAVAAVAAAAAVGAALLSRAAQPHALAAPAYILRAEAMPSTACCWR